MKKIIIIRYGEIGLKGKNRSYFEKALIRNLKSQIPGAKVYNKKKRFLIDIPEEFISEAMEIVSRTFGVQNYSLGVQTNFEISEIEKVARELVSMEVNTGKRTFKVGTRRANKRFPMTSQELNAYLGEKILDAFPELKVDVHTPDFKIGVEVRNEGVLVFGDKIPGPGGLPVGVSGSALLLLSGGIDSPVAGWYALKRGITLHAIHFASPPYTGEKAFEKVLDLAKALTKYNGGRDMLLYRVHFTKLQLAIHRNVRESLSLVIQRRAMMRIATKIAKEHGYKAIVTGENLGQVASQTIENLHTIGSATDILVLRPLTGFDKIETIQIAKKIETFEISIQPYEDCCTVFVPQQPATKARIVDVEIEESKLDLAPLLDETMKMVEIYKLRQGKVIEIEKPGMDKTNS
ncbi:tRNA uracil 4-sulfurtransferase ThiI [Kosmotoga sp.]|uniref:tRNA uracil 4-sulfurtransferase ThiI n=1 Tax=Kosmotoga sp. TaxID=1955248 RepID=UPI0024AABF37|nr:tRNA uracil 4-sulfurtransferase ThiI [Kosmotoga sp.]MDI3523729.1 tRNA uracil 4-sulfurtransferase [Kosmotoga sp.]MDK2953211.1 tRNA uracil 4-sulfurtransferase [Kosmotoga sp.]